MTPVARRGPARALTLTAKGRAATTDPLVEFIRHGWPYPQASALTRAGYRLTLIPAGSVFLPPASTAKRSHDGVTSFLAGAAAAPTLLGEQR